MKAGRFSINRKRELRLTDQIQTLLYRLGVGGYHLSIRVAALFGVGQAQKWVSGRREQKLEGVRMALLKESSLHLRPRQKNAEKPRLIWMHCASLGEFEQGRPVLEALRRAHPNWRILLTFFSPSGYERCRETDAADHVVYLPPDGPGNAQRWLAATQPDLAIFVKYEFWFFHLRELHRAGIPTFLVAGSFRPGQLFFKPMGGWWRKMLGFFTAIAVQTDADQALLTGPGQLPANRVVVTGDPRMDRTLQLAATPFTDELLANFTGRDNQTTIIAGSVWPPDVDSWREVFPQLPDHYRLVLAPHQLHEAEIASWANLFGATRYSSATPEEVSASRVLILDTIGILSRAYRYGDLAYVGGAFKTGLHNTLEPLAYGLPVIFGPKHQKFPEAAEAIRRGGAFSISSAKQLLDRINQLNDVANAHQASEAQRALAAANAGAGERTAAVVIRGLNQIYSAVVL